MPVWSYSDSRVLDLAKARAPAPPTRRPATMASNKEVLDMLTAITRRLDSIEMAVGLPSGGDGGDGEDDAPFVKAYDGFFSDSVTPFVEQCKAIGAGGEQLVRRAAWRLGNEGLARPARLARSAARQPLCAGAGSVHDRGSRRGPGTPAPPASAGRQGRDIFHLPASFPGQGVQVQEAGRERAPRAWPGAQGCVPGRERGPTPAIRAVAARRTRSSSCRGP